MILAFQGMERFYALLFTRTHVQIVRHYYGTAVLAKKEFVLPENKTILLKAIHRAGHLSQSARASGREGGGQ